MNLFGLFGRSDEEILQQYDQALTHADEKKSIEACVDVYHLAREAEARGLDLFDIQCKHDPEMRQK